MRSKTYSAKSDDSLNSDDSYRENIIIEFAKSAVKSLSFLKRAKYQVNKHTMDWNDSKIDHRSSISGSDRDSFDGNSTKRWRNGDSLF